jgi:1,2-diacylglycerol 3-alpha-glucosyltransferase
MKIGIFTDTYEPQINGVVTSINAAIDYLKKDHDIYVFCPNVTPKQSSTSKVWRFPSFVYPFQKEYRLVLPFNPRFKRIKKLNLDIIHIHTPFTMGEIGLTIGRSLGIPTVQTYHTYFEKYIHYVPLIPKKWLQYYAKKKTRALCNASSAIIVPSNEMKLVLDQYNVKTPIETLPSGIKIYESTPNQITQFKSKYMHPLKKNLLFVGRIGIEKNIYFLISAFKLILDQYNHVHLTIIGDGPERKNIEKMIQSLNLSDAITTTGYLQKEDVFSAYYAADLMTFPSKTETQGLTAVESIMCGTPVVGIKEMGVIDVIQHNVTGFLTADSITDYSSAVIEIIKNDALRRKMSDNAKILGAKFSYIESGKKLEAIYHHLLEKTMVAAP